jgi:hypothetical protein
MYFLRYRHTSLKSKHIEKTHYNLRIKVKRKLHVNVDLKAPTKLLYLCHENTDKNSHLFGGFYGNRQRYLSRSEGFPAAQPL